ncbi:MAG: formylglycine-generating enzyme family protein [Deltaproteobacteria bacterium]|nr:formylglycine-generating enzyme family protein [Deltaproteobacteria bacterium]
MSLIMGSDLAGMAAANFATIAPSLVAIEGGTFTMGSSRFEDAPEHPVTVSNFRMGRNPITNETYGKFAASLGANRFALIGADGQTGVEKLLALGSSSAEIRSSLDRLIPDAGEIAKGGAARLIGALNLVHIADHTPPANFDGSGQPAINVNWYDAFVFSALHAVRLPEEAEWEYAARVVRGERKPREYATPSGKLVKTEAHFNAGSTIDVNDSKYPTLPNGLRHMTGNVWEWTRSWYGDYPRGAVTDPIGLVSGDFKVLRGGSWGSNNPGYLRASCRDLLQPVSRSNYRGFRLAAPQDSIS